MNIHPFFLCFFCLMTLGHAFAQKSILRNGGFEEHAEQKCLSCYQSTGQYASLVYHWDNGGWQCLLCDKDYKQHPDDKKGKACPMDKISPQSGKAMISMAYLSGVNGIFGGVEGASHLSARTTESMHIGQLYEVRLWLYVESAKRHDPDWGRHLGIALLPQNLSFLNTGRKPLIIPFMGVDSLVYDKWYEVKWRVRPLCTSNYLMIGVFADPQWPKSRSYADVRYFLDNISVVEMPEVSAVSDTSVYYCSRYDPVALGATPLMDIHTLLYENDAFALTNEHKVVLDSFASYANKYPDLVFELSGHTDSIGDDNLALSQKRVETLYEYLTKVLQFQSHRFYTLSLAGTSPFRPNSTEDGRRQNRRAEIRQTNLTLSMMYYRHALQEVEDNNKAEAFSYLSKWIAKAEKGSLILLLFDPRLNYLRSDKRWEMMEKQVRDTYKNFKYPKESFLIDSLRFDACRLGTLAGMLNGLPGSIPDGKNYPVDLFDQTEAAARKRYQTNFNLISPILNKKGWPKKEEFSESTVNNVFHLLMNSGDVNAYQKWLPVLQQACEAGELPWIMYAKCYDQSMLWQGKPQRYLTDYAVLDDGSVELPPWEGDEDTVNDLRAKIGLPLLPKNVCDAMKRE
ncbi:MAG: OmpA family protein [Saprospiraceae bacterium]